MGFYRLDSTQNIPASIDTVWDFISSPHNLKVITPDYMGFEITSPNLPEKIYIGMIISYFVRPLLGIKMSWVTEITHITPLSFFVDEQRIGPYKWWHHEHHLQVIEGGVAMRDILHYAPPLGFLGSIANALFIRRQLHRIFEYRRQKIEDIFGVFKTIDR